MTGLRDVKLHLVESIDDVLKLASWLGDRRPHHVLGLDTETTGLITGVDRVRMVQVGDGVHGWAIPFQRWGGLVEDILRRWDGQWLIHNAKFDVGMLDHEGVEVDDAKVLDTRIMAHCIAPHMSTALKNVASRLVDSNAASQQAELNQSLTSGSGGWTWETVPVHYEPYWTYAALDPVLNYKIYEVLWPQVQAQCPKAFELENEVQWILAKMERYGVHIDTDYAKEKLAAFESYVDEAGRWIRAEYGVSAGSNLAVVRVLQEAGHVVTQATRAGAVALDKEVLGTIDHPLAQTVLQRRQIQKLASTYLSHFVQEPDAAGLIHPSINVLGARTSRMSMERPNLQNLPRKSTENPAADAVRSCVTAREGNVLMMCDFDQVEMRMLASMAEEQSMIAAFKGDEDFFVALAKLVYDDTTIVKSDPRRQVVKNAGYATIYGAGVSKFAVTAGITVDQASKVRHRWDELFPGVVKFQRDIIAVAQQRRETEGAPYVRCPVTGRHQVGDPGKEYALVNYLIQGAAAATFKKKIIELDNAGIGDWLMVPVHDEIIADVPEEHAADVARVFRQVMNDDQMFKVPLSASVSWGSSWGSKESYDHSRD